MKINPNLTTLNLSHLPLSRDKKLDENDIKLLVESLSTNPAITELNLSDNDIGQDGIKLLLKALETNETLKSLNIAYNKIEGSGDTIAAFLKTNTFLKTLILSGNTISLYTIGKIAEGLENNESLESLNLSATKLDDKGAQILAQALEKNTRLTKLILQNNNIGKKGLESLQKSLEKNASLSSLRLPPNKGTCQKDISTVLSKKTAQNKAVAENASLICNLTECKNPQDSRETSAMLNKIQKGEIALAQLFKLDLDEEDLKNFVLIISKAYINMEQTKKAIAFFKKYLPLAEESIACAFLHLLYIREDGDQDTQRSQRNIINEWDNVIDALKKLSPEVKQSLCATLCALYEENDYPQNTTHFITMTEVAAIFNERDAPIQMDRNAYIAFRQKIFQAVFDSDAATMKALLEEKTLQDFNEITQRIPEKKSVLLIEYLPVLFREKFSQTAFCYLGDLINNPKNIFEKWPLVLSYLNSMLPDNRQSICKKIFLFNKENSKKPCPYFLTVDELKQATQNCNSVTLEEEQSEYSKALLTSITNNNIKHINRLISEKDFQEIAPFLKIDLQNASIMLIDTLPSLLHEKQTQWNGKTFLNENKLPKKRPQTSEPTPSNSTKKQKK